MDISADRHALEMVVKNNDIYHEKFKQCVEPVMHYFGAEFLYMDCVSANGEYWALHTNPELFKFYVLDADGFKNDPLFRDPSLQKLNIYIWPTNDDGKFIDKFNKKMHERFGIAKGITFCLHDKKSYYGLAFGTSKNNGMINRLINEFKFVNNFKFFILNEMKGEVTALERNSFNAARYAGAKYSSSIGGLSQKAHEEKIQMLIKTKQIKEEDLEYLKIRLSPREKQCAALYLSGHNLNEICNILGIAIGSNRATMHILKTKLGVKNKEELKKILQKLDLLDYFSLDEIRIGVKNEK
jgi:DNA-binding CsgD family transcriptional regulator